MSPKAKTTALATSTQGAFKRHFLNAKLSGLMPKPILSVEPGALLGEAVRHMVSHRVGSMVVVKPEGGIVGLLSEHAIFTTALKSAEAEWRAVPVSEVMATPPLSVRALGSIGRAIYEMNTGRVRHLLVDPPSESGAPIGIISMRDILRHVYEMFSRDLTRDSATWNTKEVTSDLKRFLHATASELKPHAPITIGENATVHSAMQLMHRNSVGSILIAAPSKRLLGIFTERDHLVRVADALLDPKTTLVKDVMTASPRTILESGSVALALNVMFEGGFRHVPVVDATESLTGIISLRNFLQVLNDSIMGSIEG